MMNRLIATLFLSREYAHREHLRVTGVGSYAAHKALNEFYDEIVELADKFAEAYQGKHGLIGPISLMNARKTSNITEFLQDQVDEIEKVRYEVCDKTETALQNIIDEIVGLYLSTLYKLRFLA